jgi:hypothetical protein
MKNELFLFIMIYTTTMLMCVRLHDNEILTYKLKARQNKNNAHSLLSLKSKNEDVFSLTIAKKLVKIF